MDASQHVTTVEELADRVEMLSGRDRPPDRLIVGIVGEPGSGKSTVADDLVRVLESRGIASVVVPMDGFHLSRAELERRGLADRKGAPESFDGLGYAELLEHLRSSPEESVSAPAYDRTVEEVVDGAVEVAAGTTIVITEGNYLLLDGEPWCRVAPLLALSCAVEVDADVRLARLIDRHVFFGRSPEDARAWVDRVDEPNATLVRDSMHGADVAIRLA
ncbi:MAG: nucleoside/nucleotide kinase family protein [Ornithinibacter sp.]